LKQCDPDLEVQTDGHRINDNEKLSEKVDEALAVFNDYVKTQGDGSAQAGINGGDPQATDGPREEIKA